MAGKIWTDEERLTFIELRQRGMSVGQIVADPNLLPGRSEDSMRQLMRRLQLADPVASARAKDVVHFSNAQQKVFCEFLREHSTASLTVLTTSWNRWAEKNQCPTVTRKTFTYWFKKLRIQRPKKGPAPKGRRRSKRPVLSPEERRARMFARRRKAFDEQCESRLAEFIELAEPFRQQKCAVAFVPCGCCGNEWPLEARFFARLPGIFGFDGEKVNEHQTEFCQFCDWKFTTELELLRRYKKDVAALLELRKRQRRRGIDKAFDKQLEAARVRRDKLFKRSKKLPRQTCIRCSECWPLDKQHFRPNRGTADGEATYRALCTYCDHYYVREIDRRHRDGLSDTTVVRDRNDFLRLARDNQRQTWRQAAMKRRDELLKLDRRLATASCKTCAEPWIVDPKYAHEFWAISQYQPAHKSRRTRYVSKECNCCRADRAAKQRRDSS